MAESPGGARSGGGDELCPDQPPVVARRLEPAAGGHVRSVIFVGPLSAAAVNTPGDRRSRHVGVAGPDVCPMVARRERWISNCSSPPCALTVYAPFPDSAAAGAVADPACAQRWRRDDHTQHARERRWPG